MKRYLLFCAFLLVLACGKKEVTEFVSPPVAVGNADSTIEIKIMAQNSEKIALDDEIAVQSANLAETKTTTLNVSCDAAGLDRESKKMRLTRNKNYRFLQLIPKTLITNNKLNFLKNLTCMFSFTYQKNKTKELGPLVFDNTSYMGNLPLRRGTRDFPRDPNDVVLPNQVNDIQFDFPYGQAAITTLICDQFISREVMNDLKNFQLSHLVYKGIKSVDGKVSGAQNCRLVIESIEQSEEVFISKIFLVILRKEALISSFSTNFSTMPRINMGAQNLFSFTVANPNNYSIEVQLQHLPQQFFWQPVYSAPSNQVYVLSANFKTITWSITEGVGSVSGTTLSLVLGPHQKAVITGSTHMNVGCGETFLIPGTIIRTIGPLIAYLIELDSNAIVQNEFFQGAPIGESEFSTESSLRASIAGNKKWIPVKGIDYPQRFNWFADGITIYKGVDSKGNVVRHCTNP